MILTAQQLDPVIRGAVARWGKHYGVTIDPAIVKGIIERESSFVFPTPKRTEPDGRVSRGLMQVLETTARSELGITNPATVLETISGGIDAGVHYFARLLFLFKGDVTKAIAAYNAGEGRITRGSIPNPGYIAAVLSFSRKYGTPLGVVLGLTLVGFILFALGGGKRQ